MTIKRALWIMCQHTSQLTLLTQHNKKEKLQTEICVCVNTGYRSLIWWISSSYLYNCLSDFLLCRADKISVSKKIMLSSVFSSTFHVLSLAVTIQFLPQAFALHPREATSVHWSWLHPSASRVWSSFPTTLLHLHRQLSTPKHFFFCKLHQLHPPMGV